jgi:hypothetical protein
MRIPIKFVLSLAILLLGMLIVLPSRGWATVQNCPQEPTSTTIVSGEDYAGSNCVLYTPGDVDSFVFSANSGDTWQIILAYQGGYPGTCLDLYDPNGKLIFPPSGNSNNCTGNGDLVVPQTLTVTGKYTMNLSMQGDSTDGDYALSLERINPFPSDAQPLTLATSVSGTLAPANQQTAYTFYGYTSGTYQVSVSYTGGYNGTCYYLYYPGSATAQPPPEQGCTGNGDQSFTFQPPNNGYYMVLLTGQNDGSGGDYSIEVSCYLGTCKQPPPSCTLKDALTYSSSTDTLTMSFTVENSYPVTWNAWLTYQNTLVTIPGFPISQPITNSPVTIPKTYTGLGAEGIVGVLSTFTTSTGGITCSSWQLVNSGKP